MYHFLNPEQQPMKSFVPGPDRKREFRDALGRLRPVSPSSPR